VVVVVVVVVVDILSQVSICSGDEECIIVNGKVILKPLPSTYQHFIYLQRVSGKSIFLISKHCAFKSHHVICREVGCTPRLLSFMRGCGSKCET